VPNSSCWQCFCTLLFRYFQRLCKKCFESKHFLHYTLFKSFTAQSALLTKFPKKFRTKRLALAFIFTKMSTKTLCFDAAMFHLIIIIIIIIIIRNLYSAIMPLGGFRGAGDELPRYWLNCLCVNLLFITAVRWCYVLRLVCTTWTQTNTNRSANSLWRPRRKRNSRISHSTRNFPSSSSATMVPDWYHAVTVLVNSLVGVARAQYASVLYLINGILLLTLHGVRSQQCYELCSGKTMAIQMNTSL